MGYEFEFIYGLKPDFVGLPIEYARLQENVIRAYLGQEELMRIDENASDFEKTLFRSALKGFTLDTLLRVNWVHDLDFYCYIADSDRVQISSAYEDTLKEKIPSIRIISSQRVSSKRWTEVKMLLDGFDVKYHHETILNTKSERDVKIFEMIYGLNNSPKLTVNEVATRLNLTRSRIYQIIEPKRFKFFYKKSETTDWFLELGRLCLKNRICIDMAMDYMELRFGGDFVFLKNRIAYLRSSGLYLKFIHQNESRFVSPAAEKLQGVGVDVLPISIRGIEKIKEAGISYIAELATLSEGDLIKRVPTLRGDTLNEIKNFLEAYQRE